MTPTRRQDTCPAEAPPPAGGPEGAPPGLSGRILVVDDEPVIRELLAMVLSGGACEVVCCATGREALALLGRERFDVLLVDLSLPDLDGVGLHRELVARGHPDAGRLVLLTGDATSEVVAGFLRDTGLPALSKPFDLSELAETVGRLRQPQPAGPVRRRR